ncbi:iron-containing alcohol dehydrogenase [Inhella sp.]|uniref:iron-containing alcohol dehydrogenase n=1 Tax=Inhella sp. TaxID=1921806 RepID=UPI0035B10547
MHTTSFEFRSVPRIVVARGGAQRLADWLPGLAGMRRPLLVTDPGVRALAEPCCTALREAGVALAVFDAVQPDPPPEVVERALALAREHRADGVIGLGGGSSLDSAKLVALLAGSRQELPATFGVNQASGPRLPLVLVPTTAGTGSEVTPIAIVTTGADTKQGIVSPWLLPDLALLDATLIRGLPPAVTAATGIDAMVHAIEAYTSLRLKNPMSDALALQALALLDRWLPSAWAEGEDLEAREQTLLGACMAGMAFANAPVAAVHALAYPLGARFHVPHGLSNALVLGPVLRFNAPQAELLYAELGRHLGLGAGRDETSACTAFIEHMAALSGRLGLPTRLRDVGVQAGDLDRLADDALLQTRLLINNPRPLTRADARELYASAL